MLAIGNSFATGAVLGHLSPLARVGRHDLTIGVASIGGASLQVHAENITSQAPAYTFHHIGPGGTRTTRDQVRLDEALDAEAWDVVTLQQASALSGVPEQLDPALATLVAHIRERIPSVQILVHQTWAYARTTQSPLFTTYDRDQCLMYGAVVDTYDLATAEVSGGAAGTLIPSGTAVQLARSAGIPESSLTVDDGMHLQAPGGQFLTALTWYQALFGEPAPETYRPSTLDAAEEATLRESANNAFDWRDGIRFVIPCRPAS